MEGTQIVDVDAPLSHDPPKFAYDTEWLGICRAMNPYLSTSKRPINLPAPDALRREIDESIQWIKEHVGQDDKDIGSVQMFLKTSPDSLPNFKGRNYPQRKFTVIDYSIKLTLAGSSVMVHEPANCCIL